MSEINILHLSDLHISKDNMSIEYEKFVKKITSSLQENLDDLNIDLVAVTGDVIDKGNKESYKNICVDFFRNLAKSLEIDKNKFYFVPGNHDAERNDNLGPIVMDAVTQGKSIFANTNNSENFNTTFLSRYKNFCEFKTLFYDSETNLNNSYGVVHVKASNDKIVRLVLMNSAICTFGNDYGKIGISHFQLDELVKQCNTSKEKPNITIALLHHPLEWLEGLEKELVEEYFSDKDKLGVNIVLHGHTHENNVYGSFGINNSINCLSTGIGYKKESCSSSHSTKNSYKMAIYNFNTENNQVKIKLLRTNKQGDFRPDTEWNSEIVNNNGELMLDYKSKVFKVLEKKRNESELSEKFAEKEKFSKISVNLPIRKKKIVDEMFINELEDVLLNVNRLRHSLLSAIERYKTELRDDRSKENLSKSIKHLNNEEKARLCELRRDKFKSFLREVCLEVIQAFFGGQNIDNVRTHFRIYNNNKYHVLYVSSLKEEGMRDIRWDKDKNLIYHSYFERRALVNSINPELSYVHSGSKWKDFITIPLDEYTSEIPIPKLSFGISITEELSKKTNILELLSYVRVETLFLDILKQYKKRVDDYTKSLLY